MKTFIFLILSVFWGVFGATLAQADEASKIYAHKVFKNVGDRGDVHVLIHADGHLIGNPFTIHIRPDCDHKGFNWRKLNIKAAESACFVDKSAIELNRATGEIFVKILEMDRADFQKQLMKSPTTARPKCLDDHTVIKFDVKELCE